VIRRVDGVGISNDTIINVSTKLYEKAAKTVPLEIRETIKSALDKESKVESLMQVNMSHQ
jgi:hypothetical protein